MNKICLKKINNDENKKETDIDEFIPEKKQMNIRMKMMSAQYHWPEVDLCQKQGKHLEVEEEIDRCLCQIYQVVPIRCLTLVMVDSALVLLGKTLILHALMRGQLYKK